MRALTLLCLALFALPISAEENATPAGYSWKRTEGNLQYVLRHEGKLVGWYDGAKGEWWRYDRSNSAGPIYVLVPGGKPPIALPMVNYGVRADKLIAQVGQGGEQITIGGMPASKDAVRHAIDNNLPDFSGKLRVTVIGPKSVREAVEKDLKSSPEFSGFRDKIIVAGYEPDHWHVKEAGFVVEGKPSIYVQEAGGSVLHRQADYEGGAKGLAEAIAEAAKLRKPDPDYRKDKDVDLRKKLLPWLPWPGGSSGGIPPVVWILGGVALVAILLRRKQ